MEERPIILVGAGALGILYGQRLTAAYGPDRVAFAVDGDRAARYRATGFSCNGQPCDFRFLDPAEESPKASLILFAVKFGALQDAAELVRPLVGEDTVILSLLNGISSEGVIGSICGEEHLLYCVALGMDAVREGHSLHYSKPGLLQLGERDDCKSQRLEEVLALLRGADIQCEVPTNVLQAQWNKLMVNTGVNQACAYFGIPYGGVQVEGEARKAMCAAMEEVLQVAQPEGILLTREDITAWLKVIDGFGGENMPSMRQDILAGRKTEVALFAGAVRELGRKHGIPTPANDRFYDGILAIEAGR